MNFKEKLKNNLFISLNRAFGLSLGDRSVEIIELENFFQFSVDTYGRTELPDGVIENGKILDQNILAEKIKKLLKEAKPEKVSTNKVVVSLPKSQVYIKCFVVESILKSSFLLRTVLEKVSLSIPLDLDKTYWDFEEKTLPDKTKKLIVFICVPKDIANSYIHLCNSIGLEVVALDVEPLSLARTILSSSLNQSLIIDIGSRSTDLSFFDSNDKINMSVPIPFGGDQMTHAIRDKFKIDDFEAESLKVKFGFNNDKNNNIRPVIIPVINNILDETKKAISYYEETFGQTIDDVYVVGGPAMLPDITGVIKEKLNREVQIGTSNYNISLKLLTGENNYFPLFANAVGLGILGAGGEYKRLNLLKKVPSSEINSIDKLKLFDLGYMTSLNVLRTILNNKYVLIAMVFILGIISIFIFQQARNYFFPPVNNVVKTTRPVNVLPVVIPPILKLSTSTNAK